MKPTLVHWRPARYARCGAATALGAAALTCALGATGSAGASGTHGAAISHARPAAFTDTAAVARHSAVSLPAPMPPLFQGFDANSKVTKERTFSGYLFPGSIHLRTIHAEWTVSAVTHKHDGYAAAWIGTGGSLTGGSVLQIGTDESSWDHITQYVAWWERIGPGLKHQQPHDFTMRIAAGNRMYASMKQTSPHHWTLFIKDLTTHKQRTVRKWWYTHGLGAEFVVENPPGSWGFPVFSPIRFRDCAFNGNRRLKLSARWEMIDSHGRLMDRVSAPKDHGHGFTVTYVRHH